MLGFGWGRGVWNRVKEVFVGCFLDASSGFRDGLLQGELGCLSAVSAD